MFPSAPLIFFINVCGGLPLLRVLAYIPNIYEIESDELFVPSPPSPVAVSNCPYRQTHYIQGAYVNSYCKETCTYRETCEKLKLEIPIMFLDVKN